MLKLWSVVVTVMEEQPHSPFIHVHFCLLLWAWPTTAKWQTLSRCGSWLRLASQPGCLFDDKHSLAWAGLTGYTGANKSCCTTWGRPAQAWASWAGQAGQVQGRKHALIKWRLWPVRWSETWLKLAENTIPAELLSEKNTVPAEKRSRTNRIWGKPNKA